MLQNDTMITVLHVGMVLPGNSYVFQILFD